MKQLGTIQDDKDVVNKKYVDDAVSAVRDTVVLAADEEVTQVLDRVFGASKSINIQ